MLPQPDAAENEEFPPEVAELLLSRGGLLALVVDERHDFTSTDEGIELKAVLEIHKPHFEPIFPRFEFTVSIVATLEREFSGRGAESVLTLDAMRIARGIPTQKVGEILGFVCRDFADFRSNERPARVPTDACVTSFVHSHGMTFLLSALGGPKVGELSFQGARGVHALECIILL